MLKTLLSSLAGILLALVFFTLKAEAQSPPCPGASDIPPTKAWTHASTPATFSVPGTSCTGGADYCHREVDNFPALGETSYESIILWIVPDGCDGVNTNDLFDAATEAVVTAALQPLNLDVFPPCDEHLATIHGMSLRPACWTKHQLGDLHPCGDGSGYCVYKCDICDNNGAPYRFNCTYSEIGTPSCTTEAPTTIGDWNTTTCFHVHCGAHP